MNEACFFCSFPDCDLCPYHVFTSESEVKE